jgi:hypothetical protein
MCMHHSPNPNSAQEAPSLTKLIPLQPFQLQSDTHLTASTSFPPRPKACRTHAATPTTPTSKTAATTTSNPMPSQSPILSTNPTVRLKQVRLPPSTHTQHRCVFLFPLLTPMTTATFPDGTVFGWFIPFEDFPGNGSNPPFQSAVGFGTNNPEDPKKWTCYKDNDRVLFTKDGVAWTTLFWCF